jgi:hypothetical protein
MTDNDPLRDRVNEHKGRFPALAKEARVSYSWLCKYAAGAIPCPRSDTRARLYAATESAVAKAA